MWWIFTAKVLTLHRLRRFPLSTQQLYNINSALLQHRYNINSAVRACKIFILSEVFRHSSDSKIFITWHKLHCHCLPACRQTNSYIIRVFCCTVFSFKYILILCYNYYNIIQPFRCIDYRLQCGCFFFCQTENSY